MASGDLDTTWVAQGSNVMARQTFAAIWVWIAGKLPTYKAPVIEIEVNTNLDTTIHNGRLLICSQPLTLTPLTPNMGTGFQCTVIKASAGNVTLASGFISSNGSLVLAPWQSATLSCATILCRYSRVCGHASGDYRGDISARLGHCYFQFNSDLVNNHTVLASTVGRRGCFILYCAVSPSQDDYLDRH